MFLDLDRFKNINDSLGHTAGDRLLQSVAQRIKEVLRGGDTVARFGGDEFTILLDDLPGPHRAAEVSNRIIEVMAKPFDLFGHQIVITPSIGIVLFPEHGLNSEELLMNADTAMYQAKNLDGNGYSFYTESMNLFAQARSRLEEKVRLAFDQDEFCLHYQPQVDYQTGEIVGLEALSRWNDKDKNFISPAVFVPVVEDCGMIIRFGENIIKKSMQEIKLLHQEIGLRMKIAINIAPRHFKHYGLLDCIKHTINEYRIEPELLENEITEDAAMDNVTNVIDMMKKLRDLGVSLTIDDFGTGFSSLSYLKQFPILMLKNDRSFVIDMDNSGVDKSIVKAIIDLAHNLNNKVVAEGVESAKQAEVLSLMECDYIQGFIFSEAIAHQEVATLLKSDYRNRFKLNFSAEP